MIDHEKHFHGSHKLEGYATKKCPYCYTYLALNAKVCDACRKKVGEVDKLGFAKKLFDWFGYLIAILSIAGFIVFIWWGFFQE